MVIFQSFLCITLLFFVSLPRVSLCCQGPDLGEFLYLDILEIGRRQGGLNGTRLKIRLGCAASLKLGIGKVQVFSNLDNLQAFRVHLGS